MAAKKPKPQLQTGRNLPHRFNSYSPSHRHLPKAVPAQAIAAEPPRSSLRRRLAYSVLLLLLAVIMAGIVIGIWDARNISSAEQKMFGSGDIFSLLSRAPLKGAARGRVNILLVGYSADDPLHQGANLTDSIILLSMNPSRRNGYMLSIPRDLYVQIPGHGSGKINEVYQDGGMSLLEQVVGNDFQVPVDYYAIIDYSAVRDVVNALGGIDVTINSPDGRLYDPNIDYATGQPLVDLTNGSHHLNGEQALDLTRARGDELPSTPAAPIGFESSDFQRTADQRLVVTAIKNKLSWHLVLTPWKNRQILDAAAANVKTDVQATEIRALFGLFNSIPSNQLQSLSLRDLNGRNYLTGTYYDGDTLTPSAGLDDYSQIDAALQQLSQ